MRKIPHKSDFQTPPAVCDYMAQHILPSHTVLEPTPGEGNLVKALKHWDGNVTAPKDFFKMKKRRFDYVVMNPPFSPHSLGYKILYECMEMSDNIIALMPWLTIINGKKRTKDITEFGLVSITHLPRDVFKGSRVQCCILQMKKGYSGTTQFKNYTTH